MKKKTAVALSLCFILYNISAHSLVFHTASSTPLVNSDAISSSASVNASPIGGEIEFERFISLQRTNEMYSGCIYDGEKIWMVPFSEDKIIYYSKNGEKNIVDIPGDKSRSEKYFGGAFDGNSIYFAPYNADKILQINKENKSTAEIDINKGTSKYKGGAFDGERVWFFPAKGNDILNIDNAGEVKKLKIPYDLPDENAFSGGVIQGEKIYLVPDNYKNIVIVDCISGESEKISVTDSYSGAVNDGESIWFIPKNGSSVLMLDTLTNETESYNFKNNEDGSFSGGAYDGRSIWFSPQRGNCVIKFDTYLKNFTSFETEEDASYCSGVFDGKKIWFSPFDASSPLLVSGNNTPPVVQNIFLNVKCGENVCGEFSANDHNEGDILKFYVEKEASLGVFEADEQGAFCYKAGDSPGVDTILFYATDFYNKSNIGRVTITISDGEENLEEGYIDTRDHWCNEAALYLKDEDIAVGEKVDMFSYFYPEKNMTRGEFVIWINSALGLEGDAKDNTLPFEDTENAPLWIKIAASTAFQSKLILGSEENGKLYFNGENPINRLEVMTVIYNALKPENKESDLSLYTDAHSLPVWSLNIISSLEDAGILKGYNDNTLRPYKPITRAEAAQIIYEMLENMQKNTRERFK